MQNSSSTRIFNPSWDVYMLRAKVTALEEYVATLEQRIREYDELLKPQNQKQTKVFKNILIRQGSL